MSIPPTWPPRAPSLGWSQMPRSTPGGLLGRLKSLSPPCTPHPSSSWDPGVSFLTCQADHLKTHPESPLQARLVASLRRTQSGLCF